MNDQIIGVRQWCDGSIRDVYADRDGQYIRSGSGGKVYGTWIEEVERLEPADSGTATLVARADSTLILQALSSARPRF